LKKKGHANNALAGYFRAIAPNFMALIRAPKVFGARQVASLGTAEHLK